jgi:hypothetical protein
MINAAIYDGNSGGVETPVPTTAEFVRRELGVVYRFDSLTARASFVNYKVAGSFNNNVRGGGLEYKALASLDFNGGTWVTSERNHTADHSLLAGVETDYFLTKKTSLYALFG